MIIDTHASMLIPQEMDIRIRKKNEAQDLRPIEDTGNSNSPELDFNKEEPTEVNSPDTPIEAGDIREDIYSARGKLSRESEIGKDNDYDNRNIDIIV